MKPYAGKLIIISMSNVKRLTTLSMLGALATILSVLETMIGLPFGIRFGLANCIALIAINIFGIKEMAGINLFRVIISGLLSGTFLSYPFWMSVAGVSLASIVMILLFCHASLLFVSLMGAFAHDLGQILVLTLFVNTSAFLAYLPIMLIFSFASGTLNALIAKICMTRLQA